MWTKWEYRQEIFEGMEKMNELGAEGWELVATIGKDGAFLIFRREIKSKRRGVSAEAQAAAQAGGGAPGGGGGGGGGGTRPGSGGSGAAGGAGAKKRFKEMI